MAGVPPLSASPQAVTTTVVTVVWGLLGLVGCVWLPPGREEVEGRDSAVSGGDDPDVPRPRSVYLLPLSFGAALTEQHRLRG